MPAGVAAAVARIGENCEPALCSVIFMAGAGGSLRAGATENPVLLTRAVQNGTARVTSGGAAVHVWPGGGITYMVDVARMPAGSFGHVPTPALVAPIEFTLPRDLYARLGGHIGRIRPLAEVLADPACSMPVDRLHLHHGPIDLICRAWGAPDEVEAAYAQASRAFAPVLGRLCEELKLLRTLLPAPRPLGPVARAMHDACLPHPGLTPMAAVAGAVADHVLAAMCAGRRLTRAFVNNGGDIALHLAPGQSARVGVYADLARFDLRGGLLDEAAMRGTIGIRLEQRRMGFAETALGMAIGGKGLGRAILSVERIAQQRQGARAVLRFQSGRQQWAHQRLGPGGILCFHRQQGERKNGGRLVRIEREGAL
eukprot:gene3783-5175_t